MTGHSKEIYQYDVIVRCKKKAEKRAIVDMSLL